MRHHGREREQRFGGGVGEWGVRSEGGETVKES